MKFLSISLTLMLATFAIIATTAPSHAADQAIRFGVPPWPGVEVKSEVATQILDTLGYPTTQLEVGPPIIYNGFTSGEMDAFLGAWIPQQNDMLQPLLDKGVVEVAQTNLDTAVISLCVPRYVADAGVSSFADLAPNADKFKHRVYNIEVGSGMHTNMGKIIANNVAGLGDWEQIGTTTPIMLAEVRKQVDDGDWVAFGCWKPHWMNLMLDMVYLKGVPGTEDFSSDSVVYTVVRSDLKQTDPEVYRFLTQLKVTDTTQSEWIMDYARKEQPRDEVARTWIAANQDTVAAWLDGVNAADGRPAMDKIKEEF